MNIQESIAEYANMHSIRSYSHTHYPHRYAVKMVQIFPGMVDIDDAETLTSRAANECIDEYSDETGQSRYDVRVALAEEYLRRMGAR